MFSSAVAHSVRRWHRPLTLEAGLMGALAVFCLAAMLVDDRQLLGESVWLKPFKFAIAFLLYSATLAWLVSLPHKGSRITWWLGTVFAVTGVIDVGFIVLQAARGTFSHFNTDHADKVNDIGQWLFASGVPGLFLANLVIAVIVSWQRVADRPTSRAIHAGLGIAVFGMALGYLMGGTGAQLVHDAAGRPITLAAGHTVLPGHAVERDGLAGMPITHWSTVGGDLRVPHFAGLHGIQILLLAAIALAWSARRHPWLTERVRARLIGVFALAYFVLVVLLLRQALHAQPLIHPDTRTALAFVAWAAATLGATTVVVMTARPSTASRPRDKRNGHAEDKRSGHAEDERKGHAEREGTGLTGRVGNPTERETDLTGGESTSVVGRDNSLAAGRRSSLPTG
ncbi:hypothetical protein [Nocardia sp. NPDC051570]|uniref:hypothetical protein n=1 Tax=Nocardia sp. NPDC051570 TaxID=3364324 RepID=UPI0037909A51